MKNKKTLVVFDFDKTITTKHTFWRFLKFVIGTPSFIFLFFRYFRNVIKVLQKKMDVMQLRKMVLVDIFENYSWDKYLWKSKNFANTKINSWINKEAIEKLEFHKSQNHIIALVSNATEEYLNEWAKDIGFDLIIGTKLEVVEGKLTGRTKGGDCFGLNKLIRLEEMVGSLSNYELYVYGDSRGDAELLSKAQYPFYRNLGEAKYTNLPYLANNSDESNEILIVGAGPVGLTLACELARYNVKFRIIDKAINSHKETRAFALHAKSMEVFETIGIAEILLKNGRIIQSAKVKYQDREIFNTDFSKLDTDYPFLLSIPQNIIEEILEKYLFDTYGVTVERGVSMDKLTYNKNSLPIVNLLNQFGESEIVAPSWLIAADGARSRIRKQLNLTFDGDCFGTAFIVIDAEIENDNNNNNNKESVDTCLNEKGYLLVAPFPGDKHRLVIEVPHNENDKIEKITEEEVRNLLIEYGFDQIEIKKIDWLTKTKVQRRIVESFKVGRVFFVGDAAHINSPVGGQGMNLGIRDAFNLAWKLAFVVSGKAEDSLLYSYSAERSKMAEQILKNTNNLNKILSVKSFVKRFGRNTLMYFLNQFPKTGQNLAKAVSGINNKYDDSFLTVNSNLAGSLRIKPGERFPNGMLWDEHQNNVRIHDLFKNKKFTVFACFDTNLESGNATALEAELSLIEHKYSDVLDIFSVNTGLEIIRDHITETAFLYDNDGYFLNKFNCTNGLYLVRPDGYISMICSNLTAQSVSMFMDNYIKGRLNNDKIPALEPQMY